MRWEDRLETVDISAHDWLIFADWHEEYGDIDICKGIKILQEEKKQPFKTCMSIELELLLQSLAVQEDIKFTTSWEWRYNKYGPHWNTFRLKENIIAYLRDTVRADDDVYTEIDDNKIIVEFLSRFKAIITAAKAYGVLS